MSEEKKDQTTTVKILTLVDEDADKARTDKEAGHDPYDKSPDTESSQAPEKE